MPNKNIDEAIEALLAYQQADMEGVMVLTSRQAIHEVADELRRLRSQGGSISPQYAAELGKQIDELEAENARLLASKAPWDDVAEDDPQVVLVAHAIAERGIGRPWNDFLPTNAYDVDHGDLIEYARAAVAAYRASCSPPENDDPITDWVYQRTGAAVALAIDPSRDLKLLLQEARDEGLIYWEPQTSRGAMAKADMLVRIDRALASLPREAGGGAA